MVKLLNGMMSRYNSCLKDWLGEIGIAVFMCGYLASRLVVISLRKLKSYSIKSRIKLKKGYNRTVLYPPAPSGEAGGALHRKIR